MAKEVEKKHGMGEVSHELNAYLEEQQQLRNEEGIPVIGVSRHRIGIDG